MISLTKGFAEEEIEGCGCNRCAKTGFVWPGAMCIKGLQAQATDSKIDICIRNTPMAVTPRGGTIIEGVKETREREKRRVMEKKNSEGIRRRGEAQKAHNFL